MQHANIERPKILMLTNGNPHGFRVLFGLKNRGIRIAGVILEEVVGPIEFYNQVAGVGLIKAIKAIRRFFINYWSKREAKRSLGAMVCVSMGGTLNSSKMVAAIKNQQPDLIILGGIGIISQEIIDIPRYGVVNTHPALLPWVRGTGVVGRSIERGIPIGGTTHFVSKKVDTGRIIERRLLPINGPCSLRDLEVGADDLIANMMIDFVTNLPLDLDKIPAIEQDQLFPISSWMNQNERESIDRMVKAGEALHLYQKWSNDPHALNS